MPTVLRTGPYRFYFYSHEPNEPAHVHIDRDAMSIKIWLDPVGVARNDGFAPGEITALLRLTRENRGSLLEAWHGFFGTSG